MTRGISISEASNGWLATCSCGWEHWRPHRRDLEHQADKHTCRKPRSAQ